MYNASLLRSLALPLVRACGRHLVWHYALRLRWLTFEAAARLREIGFADEGKEVYEREWRRPIDFPDPVDTTPYLVEVELVDLGLATEPEKTHRATPFARRPAPV
jgi:hypothetical protein